MKYLKELAWKFPLNAMRFNDACKKFTQIPGGIIAWFEKQGKQKKKELKKLVHNRFDPKTLKPFDKVLVKYTTNRQWKCDLFSDMNDCFNYPYRCIGCSYEYCIPYNEDTKHLLGTTDEAPEYYRYWEE